MSPLLANRFAICLPPLWLVGAGVLVAVLILLAAHAVLRPLVPRLAAEARASLSEGFLGPLGWLALV